MADFTLPARNSNTVFNAAAFENAGKAWVAANDHTFVNNTDYSNLFWDTGIERAQQIYNTTRVSLPATNEAGLKILDKANRWSAANGFNVRVTSMARPQAVQDFMREQPRMMGTAAAMSKHKVGAIDLDYVRNSDGTINQAKTNELKAYLKNFYKVIDHAGHIHVSPRV